MVFSFFHPSFATARLCSDEYFHTPTTTRRKHFFRPANRRTYLRCTSSSILPVNGWCVLPPALSLRLHTVLEYSKGATGRGPFPSSVEASRRVPGFSSVGTAGDMNASRMLSARVWRTATARRMLVRPVFSLAHQQGLSHTLASAAVSHSGMPGLSLYQCCCRIGDCMVEVGVFLAV